MENTELHAQKVTILSRLIKESSLTLEEALLLLKEEEKQESVTVGSGGYGTVTTYPPLGTWSTGINTTYTVPPFISMSGATTTTITNNTTADDSADLNN
jgi:hypothetical protein